MKFKPDKKQITWGITLFVTAVAILFVYYIMFHGSWIGDGLKSLFSMLSCIIWGIVIALIMSPLLNFFENKWLKKRYLKKGIDVSKPSNARQWRAMRRFSILLTEVILIAILTVLILIIVPSMVDSLTNIAANFNSYMKNAGNSIEALFDSAQNPNKELENTIVSYFNDYSGKISSYITDTVLPNLNNVLKTVSSSVYRMVISIFNFIVGIIVSVYLLYSKEKLAGQFKKLSYALFKESAANRIIGAFRFIDQTFVGFISGKILDSIIIGIMCFAGTTIMGTPYATLVSVVVGITNVIPFFGPYIGAIFGLIVIVLINPLQALYFLIFVVILQQFDGNILGPKILGESTGISSFWVIFSIMLFGGLFGVPGWIIGVPTFAVLYAWVRSMTEKGLRKKDLPVQTEVYIDTAYIEEGKLHSLKENQNGIFGTKKIDSPWAKLFHLGRRKAEQPSAGQNGTAGGGAAKDAADGENAAGREDTAEDAADRDASRNDASKED
jgi:predicted PurR-regulated permease PerM